MLTRKQKRSQYNRHIHSKRRPLEWRSFLLGVLFCGSIYSFFLRYKALIFQPLLGDNVVAMEAVTMPWTLEMPTRRRMEAEAKPTTNITRTLVVYSGPSSSEEEKSDLYHFNLEYFLKNGGVVMDDFSTSKETKSGSLEAQPLTHHDTIFVVGDDHYNHYNSRIEKWKREQKNRGYPPEELNHRIQVMSRRPQCLDLETSRMAFSGELGVQIDDYDYFLYLNCGLTGPGKPTISTSSKDTNVTLTLPWTGAFTSKLSDTVKIAGLSLNTRGKNRDTFLPHMQSMLYAFDSTGINLIRQSKAIYNCTDPREGPKADEYETIINRYEIGMSEAILDAGYAMAPYLHPGQPQCATYTRPTLDDTNPSTCDFFDMWTRKRIWSLYDRIPSIKEVLFFKTSRLIPNQLAREVKLKGVDMRKAVYKAA